MHPADTSTKTRRPFAWRGLVALSVVILIAGAGLMGERVCARRLLQPPRTGDPDQHSHHPFEKKFFAVQTADHLRLDCLYGNHPSSQTLRGSALILHGHGSNKDDYTWLARALTERGFAVITYDARAHGKSAGEICTVGAREGADAIAVMSEAEKMFPLPHPRFVIGHSMGAASAIRMITLPGHGMDGAILVSPYARLRAIALGDVNSYLPFAHAPRLLRTAEVLAGEDVWSFSPVDLARQITIPTLFLHGTEDGRFRMSEVREVFAATGSDLATPPAKGFVEIPAAGHRSLLQPGQEWSPEVLRHIDQFLNSLTLGNLHAPIRRPK